MAVGRVAGRRVRVRRQPPGTRTAVHPQVAASPEPAPQSEWAKPEFFVMSAEMREALESLDQQPAVESKPPPAPYFVAGGAEWLYNYGTPVEMDFRYLHVKWCMKALRNPKSSASLLFLLHPDACGRVPGRGRFGRMEGYLSSVGAPHPATLLEQLWTARAAISGVAKHSICRETATRAVLAGSGPELLVESTAVAAVFALLRRRPQQHMRAVAAGADSEALAATNFPEEALAGAPVGEVAARIEAVMTATPRAAVGCIAVAASKGLSAARLRPLVAKAARLREDAEQEDEVKGWYWEDLCTLCAALRAEEARDAVQQLLPQRYRSPSAWSPALVAEVLWRYAEPAGGALRRRRLAAAVQLFREAAAGGLPTRPMLVALLRVLSTHAPANDIAARASSVVRTAAADGCRPTADMLDGLLRCAARDSPDVLHGVLRWAQRKVHLVPSDSTLDAVAELARDGDPLQLLDDLVPMLGRLTLRVGHHICKRLCEAHGAAEGVGMFLRHRLHTRARTTS
eukprot:TRINITY_DN10358_c0_g1_i2.p1 TRINITY_DN10358_c0_g1~~TRINITY_DN10358_c0_g1_i2.p1  ORF type:complete len:525 (+),score=113.59 TRINITY_DN10358_c0_g1_i2:35-1576(+)